MDLLWQVGVGNALAAAALAVPAALAGWIGRRPALTHALWLLVLIKLLTPPFYPLQFQWPESRSSEQALVVTETGGGVRSQPFDRISNQDDEPNARLTQPGLAEPRPDGFAETPEPEPVAQTIGEPGSTDPITWKALAATVWLAGSASWLALASLRFIRFHRLLRHARPAGKELTVRTQRLAETLGLKKPPAVRLIPGALSPLLWWSPSGATLILPHDLIGRLTIEQCEALLTHELAHLRRRDHWVRVLEFLATGIFWWHPILWWARREIREAEEQCCDAWVVWALPALVRGYALALVETVDFLSEARPALPPVASGIGYVRDLRRRMTMIMRGTTPRVLTWSGALLVLGVAAFMLPILPTLAQAPPPESRSGPAPEDDVKRAEDELQKARARLEQAQRELRKKQETSERTMKPGARNDVCLRCHVNVHFDMSEAKDRSENLHDDIIKLSAMAEEQRAALSATEAKLEATLKKFAELTRSRDDKGPRRPDPRPGPGPGGPMAPDGSGSKPPPGGDRFQPGPVTTPRDAPFPLDGKPGAGDRGGRFGPEQEKRIDELQVELKKRMEMEKHNQDRIQDLTNQVDRLIKEMERMRKEMRDRAPEKPSKEVERPERSSAPDDPKRREGPASR
jgi:beta-lactamase regulating signal transducer with metallopeptidase domain